MLYRKILRTMGQYKAQFISMIIMITIGVGVFTGFNAEWRTIEYNTNNFFEETGFSDYRIMEEGGFSEKDLAKVEKIKGVDKASRVFTYNVEIEGPEHHVMALTVTENPEVSGVHNVAGEDYDPSCKDGIWLSDKYADANNIAVGDNMGFTLMGKEVKTQVKGLVKSSEYMVCLRDKTQMLPDYETYGFAYISPKMYEKESPMAIYTQINVLSDLGKEKFSHRVDDIFGRTMMIVDKDETPSYGGSRGEMDEGKTMATILPVIFLAIAVLTMVTTMHRIATKEKVQIGIFKALGFKDRKILISQMFYAIFTAIAGLIPGLIVGYLLAYYVMNPKGMMSIYIDMPEWKIALPSHCYPVLLVIILLLVLTGYLSTKNILKGTAAETLAPPAPAEMKPMKIEKTQWFQNRTFGTKWNLRDISRHKMRTLMCLFGVFGCTLIMFACFGLNDTMGVFTNKYYNGMINYQSRIYIESDADKEARQKIIDKYGGDWSGLASIKLDGDPIALEVYNLGDGMITFDGVDGPVKKLDDNGAYICKRIADEHGYSKGDTITINPYESEKQYNLKVAGVIRNLTEGLVISPEYAKAKGIDYEIDSVYSNEKAKDIEKNKNIASIKSKENLVTTFDDMFEIMDVMIVALVAAGLILAIIVLYNLGSMSYMERYRELATLKVVGFKDKRIRNLLTEQNLWITIVGTILGMPVGYFALSYLMDALAAEYELLIVVKPLTYVFCIGLTFLVSLLVSYMLSRKNRKIDMVEALKIDE